MSAWRACYTTSACIAGPLVAQLTHITTQHQHACRVLAASTAIAARTESGFAL